LNALNKKQQKKKNQEERKTADSLSC